MRQQILPALQTVGSVDPHTLILELPNLSRQRFEESLLKGGDQEPARLYAHELHHWLDIVGSLWGQRYLDLLFSAFDAVLAAKTEDSAYVEVLRLFDADRAILFPRYYKYVTPEAPHGAIVPWINRWSAGQRIKLDGTRSPDDPILFVRIETETQIIARQPLSVGALLELRAMAAEEEAFRNALVNLTEEEKVIENAMHDRYLKQYLYDPELITYSAAAHVLSTSSGVGSIGPVFALGAALADICLSLDRSMLRNLRPPPLLAEFGHRIIHGFKSGENPGFAYACAVAWLKDNRPAELDAACLDRALKGIGLPNALELYRTADRSFVRRAIPKLQSDRLRNIRTALLEDGLLAFRSKGASFGILPPARWANSPSPLVMTGDLEQFHVGKATISLEDGEWLDECKRKCDLVLRQALRAGRGLDFAFTDYIY
ncbi:MAG: hypothetical protein E5W98_01245 [Mesorhizobium sp.]|nr:MAG: hypothetical protein E5W98_01245 [Mesorhizobium sp.]